MSPKSIPTISLNRRQRRLLASGRARVFNDAGTGIAIPDTAEGLRETLENDDKLVEIVNGGKLGDFIRAYADKHASKNADVKEQIRDEAKRVLAEMLREEGIDVDGRPDLRDKLPDPFSTPQAAKLKTHGLYNKAAIGATVEGLFDASGDFFRAIWRGNPEKDSDDVKAKLEKLRNYSSDIPSDGGYLIPETLRSQLLQVALELAVVRPRATVVPMESLRVPFPAIDETSREDSVFGGIVGYWTEEGAQLTESEAKFGRVVLDAKKLTAYTEIPSELLTDSIISLAQFVDTQMPKAIANFEDRAFLNGDGVGKPLGFMNGTAAITVTRQNANEISFTDVLNMFARMLPDSMMNGVWLASPATIPQLASMRIVQQNVGGTENVGVASPAVWLNNGQVIDGPPMSLLGRPVIFTTKVPNLGTTGDLTFVDLSYYLLGDRQAMQARQSEHNKFEFDKVSFRVIERVDGRPWIQSAITPENGGDTLSPIVKLGSV